MCPLRGPARCAWCWKQNVKRPCGQQKGALRREAANLRLRMRQPPQARAHSTPSQARAQAAASRPPKCAHAHTLAQPGMETRSESLAVLGSPRAGQGGRRMAAGSPTSGLGAGDEFASPALAGLTCGCGSQRRKGGAEPPLPGSASRAPLEPTEGPSCREKGHLPLRSQAGLLEFLVSERTCRRTPTSVEFTL